MDKSDKLLKVPGAQFPHLETGDDEWHFLEQSEMYSTAHIGISGHGSFKLRVYSPT